MTPNDCICPSKGMNIMGNKPPHPFRDPDCPVHGDAPKKKDPTLQGSEEKHE